MKITACLSSTRFGVPLSARTLAVAIGALSVFGMSAASADTLYWDTNGTSPGLGGSGTWGGGSASSFWNLVADGTGTPGAYVAGSDVVFSAGSTAVASAVSLGGSVSANSLTFSIGATTISNSVANQAITVGLGGITLAAGSGDVLIGNASGDTKVTVSGNQTWANNSSSRLVVGGGTINGQVTIAGSGTVQLGNDGTSNSFAGTGGSFVVGTSGTSGKLALSTANGGLNNDIYLVNGTLLGAGSSQSTKVKGMKSTGLFLQGDFTIAMGNDAQEFKSLTLDANKVLTVNGTNGNSSATPFAVLRVDDGASNAGAVLTKSGTGYMWIIGNASTYSGGTVLSGGVLRVAYDESLGAASSGISFTADSTLQAGLSGTNLALVANGTVTLGASRAISIANGVTATFDTQPGSTQQNMVVNSAISGGGALQKTGLGTLTLNGANSYGGITTVSGGILAVSSLADGGVASSVGTSSNAASSLLLKNGTTLQYVGSGSASNRSFTIAGTANNQGASIDASGTGALNLTSTSSIAYGTTNQSRTLTLTGVNTDNNTLAATLTNNGSGVVSLTKAGAGKWILTGASTYSGATTVSAGTLIINGSTSASSAVSVASGATLGGSGTINGAVNVGGTLAPGNSPGNLIVNNNVTILDGGAVSMEIAGATMGTQYDRVTMTGASSVFSLNGTNNLVLTLSYTPAADALFFLVDNQGSSAISGIFEQLSGVTTDLSQGALFMVGGQQFRISYTGDVTTSSFTGGNDLVLQAVVPEPATWLLLTASLASVIVFRRARKTC